MNLQENILRIKEVMGLLNESSTPPKKDKWGRPQIKDGKPYLWYGFDEKKREWTEEPCKYLGPLPSNGDDYELKARCRNLLGIKLKDKEGRFEVDRFGEPELWYGFDKGRNAWVEGPCKGISKSTNGDDFIDKCRAKRGLKTRAEMTPDEEAALYSPSAFTLPVPDIESIIKGNPKMTVIKEEFKWPIQVNWFPPFQEKFPVGHIECVSLKERQYHFNPWPKEMDFTNVILSTHGSNNLNNSEVRYEKPTNGTTIYVYLTDSEYDLFKKAYKKYDPKLKEMESKITKVDHYNGLFENCADAVALALGVSPEIWTNTKKEIVFVSGIVGDKILPVPFMSTMLTVGEVILNQTLSPKIPLDVYNEIVKVYKGRIQWGKK